MKKKRKRWGGRETDRQRDRETDRKRGKTFYSKRHLNTLLAKCLFVKYFLFVQYKIYKEKEEKMEEEEEERERQRDIERHNNNQKTKIENKIPPSPPHT